MLLAHKDLETELSCISGGGGVKKDWSSGESIYGPLQSGIVVKLSIGFAKKLLQLENAILSALAK